MAAAAQAAGGGKQGGGLTHDEAKSRLKSFLIEFCIRDSRGKKDHVYGHQLTKIANRDQVELTIDLEHVQEHDPQLAEAIRNNVRRYVLLSSEAIAEMLPDYRYNLLTR